MNLLFRSMTRGAGARAVAVVGRTPWSWCRPAVVALLLLVAALVSTSSAQAQQPLTPVQKQQMKRFYERATRAYDVGKYSEAIEDYQRAYEIGGDPAMLYNIAQSYRLSDQPAEAVRFYRRYLLRSPNARNRDDVERKIAELEKLIDERRAAAAAAPRPAEPARSSQNSNGGTVTAAPPPVTPPPPPTTVPILDQPEPAVADDSSSNALRITGIVLVSLGGAALVTAGIAGKFASDRETTLESASEKGQVFDSTVEADGKRFDRIAIGAAIGGGVAAAAGIVLLVVAGSEPSGEEPAVARVTPWVAPGSAGATATIRF